MSSTLLTVSSAAFLPKNSTDDSEGTEYAEVEILSKLIILTSLGICIPFSLKSFTAPKAISS